MSESTVESVLRTPVDQRELDALMAILAPIFNFPPERGTQYAALVGIKNFRMLHAREALAGGLALLPMGQFFGGKSVPMTGIALVGVAPECRGSGAATTMMRAAVRELHEQGVPISTLYPATLPLYRRAGYELAGVRLDFSIPTKSIKLRDRSLIVRVIDESDSQAIEQLYRRWACDSPGSLDRNDFIWSRVRNRLGEPLTGYLAHDPDNDAPQGYVYYYRTESKAAAYSLAINDFVATTPEAAVRLLTFLADHATLAENVTWLGAVSDPILMLLPERGVSVTQSEHWMLRIVDVTRALELRGYLPGIKAEMHFEVEDDLIEANCENYVLRVENGVGHVETGGRGDLRMDVRGLAPLYTGFATPRELLGAGRIEIANAKSDESLRAAESIFAGPMPVLRDRF